MIANVVIKKMKRHKRVFPAKIKTWKLKNDERVQNVKFSERLGGGILTWNRLSMKKGKPTKNGKGRRAKMTKTVLRKGVRLPRTSFRKLEKIKASNGYR